MLLSLFVYIGLFVCMLYIAKKVKYSKYNTNRLIILTVGIIVYAIIIGCRYDVGVDYHNYMECYQDPDLRESMETLWLTKILRALGFSYPAFFITIAMLQISFFLLSFKDKREILVYAVFFYFTTLEFFLSMNVMRQVLAWCIFLFSIKFIVHRNLYKYISCIVFASLFHRSALVLLPFYFLPNNKLISYRLVLIIYIITCFMGVTFQNRIANYLSIIAAIIGYAEYGDSMDKIMQMIDFSTENSLGIAKLIWLTLDCSAIILSDKLNKLYSKKGFTIYYYLFIIGILLNSICEGTILDRATMYFLPFKIIIYAFMFNYLAISRKQINNIYIYCSVCILLVFYISSGIIGGASGCYPFKFI